MTAPAAPTAPAAHALRGTAWMIAAAVCFAATIAIGRELSAAHDVFDMVFVQSLVVVLGLLPWMVRAGRLRMGPRVFRVYALRAASGYVAMAAMFFSLRFMPVADVTALLFTAGLFTVLLAAWFLREPVGLRRWAAVVAGFGGALVIIRPGFAEVSWPVVVMLVSALGFGAVNVTARLLAYSEHPDAIVFHTFALTLVLSAAPALHGWAMPTPAGAAWLVALGVATIFSQQCVVRSFAAAPPAVTMPAYYLQLPFAAAVGHVAFGESPDLWIWVGAGIICAATYYILRVEAAARRGARA